MTSRNTPANLFSLTLRWCDLTRFPRDCNKSHLIHTKLKLHPEASPYTLYASIRLPYTCLIYLHSKYSYSLCYNYWISNVTQNCHLPLYPVHQWTWTTTGTPLTIHYLYCETWRWQVSTSVSGAAVLWWLSNIHPMVRIWSTRWASKIGVSNKVARKVIQWVKAWTKHLHLYPHHRDYLFIVRAQLGMIQCSYNI